MITYLSIFKKGYFVSSTKSCSSAIFPIFDKTTEFAAGASPRPTVMDIVCAYKSQTTRICNKEDNIPGRKIFQTSFYDEIIRNRAAYDEISKYIFENPMKWKEDELYTE